MLVAEKLDWKGLKFSMWQFENLNKFENLKMFLI
jgi:hypothetical protein